jgi:hypothetical protein
MPATKLKPKTAEPSKARPAAKKSKPATSKKTVRPTKAASATKAKATGVSKKAAGASKSKGAGAVKSATAAKKAAAEKTAPVKTAAKKQAKDVLDFSGFPAGSVTRHDVTLCLACIFKLFTNQLGLAPRTAYNEIRRYAPTVAELSARAPQRPFFKTTGEKNPHCPYCEAPKRWHAGLSVYRVEGGKYGDAARRALLKRLPTKDEQFQIHEEKRTARQVFFEWLERLGQTLDLDTDDAWMREAAREYLQRREPKTDWAAAFDGVRAVRRSQRIDEGFEREGARLFLAPALYNDVLLVQYLVSRSHRHGGRTFEGRLTLPDLVGRMRRGGHLEAQGITDRDRFDVLEQLVENLTGGGDAPARLHFIIDRRGLLERAKEVYERQTA